MASKVKLMKMLQEVRGYAQVTNRRPATRPGVLFLMQLRSGQPATPKIRLVVAANGPKIAEPLPIKITHVNAVAASLPVSVR